MHRSQPLRTAIREVGDLTVLSGDDGATLFRRGELVASVTRHDPDGWQVLLSDRPIAAPVPDQHQAIEAALVACAQAAGW